MSSQPYTPEELQGKFIVCFVALCGSRPVLDSVRYATGTREGKPYLYNSIEEARNDQNFDFDYDEAIPASEYFERLKIQRKSVTDV